jgi:hypothetical protein
MQPSIWFCLDRAALFLFKADAANKTTSSHQDTINNFER